MAWRLQHPQITMHSTKLLAGSVLLLLVACGAESEDGTTGSTVGALDDTVRGEKKEDICKAERFDRQGTVFPEISRKEVVANAKAYVDFRWTPTVDNLADGTRRCNMEAPTSPRFSAGAEQSFPYKKSGYDTIETFNTCIGRKLTTTNWRQLPNSERWVKDTRQYTGGTINQVTLGTACGVLGLDCAGFVGKAFGVEALEYTNPSFIYNACPLKGEGKTAGKDFSLAKPGDLLKRYGFKNAKGEEMQDHFQVVAFDPDLAKKTITVYEAGTGDAAKRGDIVKEDTYEWQFMVDNGFRLCTPNGLTDP